MDKKIKKHENFIKDELSKARSLDEIDSIIKIHHSAISYFQTERVVHLIVTMSFALFTLVFITLYFLTGIIIFWIPCVLISFTLFFYIIHYYRIENLIQRQSDLFEKIYEKRKEIKQVSHI